MRQSRSLRHAVAAHRMHSIHDSRVVTENARAGFRRRFEVEVDPSGTLAPEERARRAQQRMTAWMLGLAERSARVRAERRRATMNDG